MIEPSLPIRELPPSQRPRERLRAMGTRALPARELLALVIGSGRRNASALEISDRVLRRCEGRLRTLAYLDPAALEAIPGIGPATSGRIAASLELGLRALREEWPDRARIRGPDDVYRFMAPRLQDLPHEEFHALLLNTQHRVLRVAMVSRGILDASLIHPREVFRPAILENAASVVLVHNHPSGDPTPSPEDRAVTRQLSEAGRTMGIRVLDHLVIGAEGWSSASGGTP
jgi:DNA repair protein RadC